MYILGISAFYHDSAACLIRDGDIVAAAQEERFTRKKHDLSFPKNSISYCLKEEKIKYSNIDYVIFYEKPFPKFERLLETFFAFAPRGFISFAHSIPIWVKEKLFQKKLIIDNLQKNLGNDNWKDKLLFSEHHLSHAASAFFPSPFDKAAILTMDGVGEWATTSLSLGSKNKILIQKEIHFPHSLGLLYSAFTYYTGFKVNSGEYKLMGLAPYGEPKYVDLIKDNLIKIYTDGSFQLDMSYFNYCTGMTMTNNKFHKLFKGEPRKPESLITQKEMDIASSIQKVTEEIVIKIAKDIKKTTGEKNLCLAGGVALNCVANGALLKEEIFENIWIQPASGDSGGAIGAALAAWHLFLNKNRSSNNRDDKMKGSFLGPAYQDKDIENTLIKNNAVFHKFPQKKLCKVIAKELSKQKAIGWMQGKMEFGPRALGSRSIIADPRSNKMQKQLNLKVKFRESFRPFAPSILEEKLTDWFNLKNKSPYMLIVSEIKSNKKVSMTKKQKGLFGIDKLNIARSDIPAVTHVDYSARIQTVNKETNKKYFDLLKAFYEQTNCPVLINTSFNIRGEPIVCNPEDAFRCFMGCGLDILVIENYVLYKNEQNQKLLKNYINNYELD